MNKIFCVEVIGTMGEDRGHDNHYDTISSRITVWRHKKEND